MTNKDDSNDPASNPNTQSSSQPPVPTAPAAPTQHEVRDDTNERTQNQNDTARELAREFRWVEFAQLAVNGVLAVIGIVALCIYHGQLEVMRGQLGEIIKQYPEIQKSADAAKSAADTAVKTLLNAQQQFRVEQRPYIFASPEPAGPPINQANPSERAFINLNPDGSATFYWKVGIINSGHSPAKDVVTTKSETRICLKERCVKEMNSFVPVWLTHGAKEGTAFPTDVHNAVPTGEIRTFSKNDLEQIRNSKLMVYQIGAIKYRDIYEPRIEPPYETDYCFLYNPSGLVFGSCPIGNTIK